MIVSRPAALDAAYDGGVMSQTAWKVLLAGEMEE